jgi:hypothetical protein
MRESINELQIIMMNISEYISKQEKTVKSATGEIEFDWGKGLCLIDTPQAQGACEIYQGDR